MKRIVKRSATITENPAGGFDLAAFLPYRLNVLAGRVSRQLAAVYGARFDLDIAEWRILAHLSQESGVSVREVQKRVDLDKAKVTRAAKRLETRGLLTKHANDEDRRLVRLTLTEAGRARVDEIVPVAERYLERLLAVLDEDERTTFLSALSKLERVTADPHPGADKTK
mgnify:CR=1 FL=1